MTIHKTSIFAAVCFLIFLTLFTLKGIISLDPDFGYRLRTGQMILEGNTPHSDPYSYTMPSFPYVEHAVSVATMWAYLYPYVGIFGIAIVHGVITLLAFIIANKRIDSQKNAKAYENAHKPFGIDLGYFGIFPFILALATVLPYSGIRAQTISWIFISLFFYGVLNLQRWNTLKYFTPFFFLLWANTHGSWSAALAILAFLTLFRSFKAKKVLVHDSAITIASFLITVINPYGTGVWTEVWLSLTDSTLRWRILEWMPAFLAFDIAFVAFFTISVFLVIKYRKSFKQELFLVYILVLIQAILSRRHIPLWILLALPMTTQSLWQLYDEIKSIKLGSQRFKVVYKYAWIFALVILLLKVGFGYRDSKKISEHTYYPVDAISYLREHTPDGEIYGTYGWGGYLIWKLPEKKVFVDGRMPSWRRDAAPNTELANAFETYEMIEKGEIDYREIFETFNIKTVLLPTTNISVRAKSSLEIWYESILKKYNKDKTDFSLREELVNDGWEIVYEDHVSTIYQK